MQCIAQMQPGCGSALFCLFGYEMKVIKMGDRPLLWVLVFRYYDHSRLATAYELNIVRMECEVGLVLAVVGLVGVHPDRAAHSNDAALF